MVRLRAVVRGVTGETRHLLHDVGGASVLPSPVTVEIHGLDGGYFLFRLDQSGVQIADTWHASLLDAKRQASQEYQIKDDEWWDMSN